MRGPAISITTFPVERVLGAVRWMTSTSTLAASSFSSGEPPMSPSFRIVRAGPMPWGGGGLCERGRQREGGGGKEGGEGGGGGGGGEGRGNGKGKRIAKMSAAQTNHPVCEGNGYLHEAYCSYI